MPKNNVNLISLFMAENGWGEVWFLVRCHRNNVTNDAKSILVKKKASR